MSDLSAVIAVSADASGVEAGIGAAKKSIAGFKGAVVEAGAAASTALDKSGDGGKTAAKKVEDATKNIVGSIQRQIAATEAGAKSGAEYYRVLASQRGIDANVLKPYLDQLDALKSKQIAAGASNPSLVGAIEKVKSSADTAKESLLGLGKALLLGAAAGMGLDAIKNKIMGVIDSMANLKTISEKTGSSVENLSKLGFIAKQSGSDIDSVSQALIKLSKGMAGADEESKSTGRALAFLGISAKDSKGNLRDSAEVYTEISQKLNAYKDGAGKTALAIDALGKSGADQLATMKLLAESGSVLAKVTDEQAIAARQYTRDLAKLEAQKGLLFKTLAVALLPTLADFSSVLLDASKNTNVLNKAAKDLANDNSITNWADAGAMGVARLLDVIKVLPAVFTALKSSFSVVFSDIELAGSTLAKLPLVLNPANLARNITQGTNPFAEMSMQLEKRNKTLADANVNYDKLLNSEANTFEKAMSSKIAARKAEQNFSANADAKDIRARTAANAANAAAAAAKPTLNYDTSKDEKAAKVAKEKESEFAKLNKHIQEQIDLNTSALALGRDLTEAEKFRVKVTNDMNLAKVGLTATERAGIEVKLKEKEALDLLKEVQKSQLDQTKQIAAERQRIRNADYDQVQKFLQGEADLETARNKTMRDSLQGMADETAALSLTNGEREIAIKLREVERQGLDKGSAAYADYADKIRAAVSNKEAVEAGIKSQVGMWQTIESAAKDTFLSIFNSGKNAFTRLKDTLKNGLYALLYEITVKKWLINIAASVSGAGVAQQALGATGAAGGASSLMSGVNAATGAFGASALSTGMGVWGGLGELSSLGIGEALSTGFAAVTSGTLAGLSGGLGAIAGALGPIALGAVALYSLFGNKLSASKSTGSLERTYSASGAITSERSPFAAGNGAQVVDSLYSQLTSLQTLLGAKGGANFAYGAYSGTGDKNPMGRISGGSFNSGEVPTAELGLAAQRAILAALQASEMPAGIAKIINSINPATASAQEIAKLESEAATYAQSIKVISAALDTMPFVNLKGAAFDAADALVVASGGLQNLQQSLTTYFDNFYSEEEKRAQKVTDITKALNGAGVGVTEDQIANITRAQYRALVESIKQVDGVNAPAVAALYAMGGAIASITPATETAKTAITALGETISDTMKGLLKDRASLEADVMQAQGNTGGADTARRAIAVTGYSEAETAAYDYNQALRVEIKTRQDASVVFDKSQADAKALSDKLQADATAAIAASQAAAKAAAEQLAGTNAGLQDRLDVLLGKQTQRSLELRNATDDSTKSLINQINAQEDLKVANDALAQAAKAVADTLAQAAKNVIDANNAANASFNSNIGGTLAKFKTPAQNSATEYDNIAASLKAGGFANKDNAGLVDVLKAADKDRIVSLAQTVFDGLGEGAGVAKEELRKLVDRLADLKNAEAMAAEKVPAVVAEVVAVVAVIESVADAYKRLTTALKTNEQIAQERISLESRLYAATDTTAGAMDRVRNAIDPLNQALFDTVTAAESAKVAQVAAAESAKAITAERKGLQDQLNGLTDTSAQALTRQRDALDESNKALFDQVQAVTAAKVAEQERAATAQKINDERVGLQTQLNGLTDTSAQALTRQRDALNESNRALFDQVQALTAAKAIADERKGLQEQYDQLTLSSSQLLTRQRDALDSSNRSLFDSIQAIKSETAAKEADTAAREAAKQAAAKGSTDAFSALQRAVDAQRKIVQVARDAAAQSVAEITSVFDILKSSVKDLYGTVDSTAQMQANQGRAFISQALATAQSTGYLPESKALTDAINAAKGGNQEFASQFEKDFAALTLAGDLSLLEVLSKGQLTEAQKALKVQDDQLKSLDGVLSLAQQQLDAANGINTSVLSVADAVRALGGAISTMRNAQVASYVGTPTANVPTGQRSYMDTVAGTTQLSGNTGTLATSELAANISASWANALGKPDQEAAVRKFLKDLELTQSALGIQLPGFAAGTNYVPYDMTAQVHKGETIIPAFDAQQFRNGGGMGGNTERLESLVEGLTQEVQRLQAIVNDGNKSNQRIADTLENVTEGGANMRTVTA